MKLTVSLCDCEKWGKTRGLAGHAGRHAGPDGGPNRCEFEQTAQHKHAFVDTYVRITIHRTRKLGHHSDWVLMHKAREGIHMYSAMLCVIRAHYASATSRASVTNFMLATVLFPSAQCMWPPCLPPSCPVMPSNLLSSSRSSLTELWSAIRVPPSYPLRISLRLSSCVLSAPAWAQR
jgi:hypothetical protein